MHAFSVELSAWQPGWEPTKCSQTGERRHKLPVHLAERYGPLHTCCRTRAALAELVDAPDLGSGISDVQVRVLSGAQRKGYVCVTHPFCLVSPMISIEVLFLFVDAACSNTSRHHHFSQRITSKSVAAMNTASHLTCREESWNWLS